MGAGSRGLAQMKIAQPRRQRLHIFGRRGLIRKILDNVLVQLYPRLVEFSNKICKVHDPPPPYCLVTR